MAVKNPALCISAKVGRPGRNTSGRVGHNEGNQVAGRISPRASGINRGSGRMRGGRNGTPMKLEIELDIPPELVDANFEKLLKEDAVLRLFAERKIPSGRAARILALERMDFLELLKNRAIPAVDYTVEDWVADGSAIAEIERRRNDPQSKR